MASDSPYGCTFFTFDPVKGTLPDQLISDMKALGLSWLRYQLPWFFIEQKPGMYTWTALDSVVAACNSNNINLCYPIQGSPLFYDQQPGANSRTITGGGMTGSTSIWLDSAPSELPANTPVRISGGTGNPEIIQTAGSYSTGANPIILSSPITGNNRTTVQWYLYPDPQATRGFATAVATRYNGQNGHGIIQAFEIGNEEYDSQNPNGSSANAYNDRSPIYYINVLPVVAPAIRAANPAALVGICAIWWNQLPHARDFLNAIYQASPTMKNNFDYVNFHYYPFESGASEATDPTQWKWAAQPGSTVPTFEQEWEALHEVMSTNGDGGKDIRATEFGWYTNNNQPYRGTANLVTQDVQAHNYLTLLESARTSGVVSHAFLWTLDYAPANAAMHRDANGNPISDAYSLVQVQYINGQSQTTYVQAFAALKDYIAKYPQWSIQSPPTPPTPPVPGTETVLYYKIPLTIQNGGSHPLTWSATTDQSWCTLDISRGSISPGGTQVFHALIDVSALSGDASAPNFLRASSAIKPQNEAVVIQVETNAGNFSIPLSITV